MPLAVPADGRNPTWEHCRERDKWNRGRLLLVPGPTGPLQVEMGKNSRISLQPKRSLQCSILRSINFNNKYQGGVKGFLLEILSGSGMTSLLLRGHPTMGVLGILNFHSSQPPLGYETLVPSPSLIPGFYFIGSITPAPSWLGKRKTLAPGA